MSGLILAVGAAGKFVGHVIPALVARGATVGGVVQEAKALASMRDEAAADDHPEEAKALLYIEAPVMLGDLLRPVFAYTPEAMAQGSMWWWILPLAPGVPERLIVGAERAFLGWFCKGDHVINHDAFLPAVVDEYLRTFSGRYGVLGSLGVYRAAFTSIAKTEPLLRAKIKTPVWAMDGEKGLGARVGQMVALAEHVQTSVEPTSAHFLPEEAPAPVAQAIIQMAKA